VKKKTLKLYKVAQTKKKKKLAHISHYYISIKHTIINLNH